MKRIQTIKDKITSIRKGVGATEQKLQEKSQAALTYVKPKADIIGQKLILGGQDIIHTGKTVQSMRHDVGKVTGLFYRATTGKNPNIKKKRLTKAERKAERQALKQDGMVRRSPREQSKIVRGRKVRDSIESNIRSGALAYQNIRPDYSPEPRGITTQPPERSEYTGYPRPERFQRTGSARIPVDLTIGDLIPMSTQLMIDDLTPVSSLSVRGERDTFLAQPERAKTHHSYSNMDFFGTKSKKGAVDWRYDYEEQFR